MCVGVGGIEKKIKIKFFFFIIVENVVFQLKGLLFFFFIF